MDTLDTSHSPDSSMFLKQVHAKYLRKLLDVFPSVYAGQDSQKLHLLYFVLSSMDLLGSLDDTVGDAEKHEIIDWLYGLQITTRSGLPLKCCGFRGSHTLGQGHQLDTGHLAMTYLALLSLLILGDDLSRIDRLGILAGVRECQLADGSFSFMASSSESDMRVVYCACAVSAILRDFRAIKVPHVLNYIRDSLNYDGGFGQAPFLESHGGSTYCALASLHLLRRLHGKGALLSDDDKHRIRRWCVSRQKEGFNGRPHKDDDSCYTFWIGAALSLLDSDQLIDKNQLTRFVLSTQDSIIGGFGKHPGELPDILHTYLSLAGLSLLNRCSLASLEPAINLSLKSLAHLDSVRETWTPVDQEVVNCCTE